MTSIRLSFNTWVYSSFGTWIPSYTLEETITRIARIGYDGIEIGAGSPHAYPKHVSAKRRRDIKELLVDSGIVLSSMLPGPGGAPGYNPASPIFEERQDTVEQYKEVIQLCSDWGGKIVIYVPGWPVAGTSQQQAWEWSRQALTEIAGSAADCGIMMAIEAMYTKVVETPEDANRMMEEVGSSSVRLMFDTVNVIGRNESLTDYVHRMGKNLCHIHLSDNDRLAPGQGRGDFPSLIQALKATGFDGYATMEIGYNRADIDADEIARQAYEYTKALLNTEAA